MLDTSDLSVVGYKKNSSNGSAVLRQKPRSKSATPMCTGVNLAGIFGDSGTDGLVGARSEVRGER